MIFDSISLGTAAVCLLSEHMTTVRQRIDVPVPRKRMGSATLHEKVFFGLFDGVDLLTHSFVRA